MFERSKLPRWVPTDGAHYQDLRPLQAGLSIPPNSARLTDDRRNQSLTALAASDLKSNRHFQDFPHLAS